MDGYIYLVYLPSLLAVAGYIYKIGVTKNPKNRLKAYKNAEVVICHKVADYLHKEKVVKRAFRHKAVIGQEWFCLTQIEKIEIKHFILGNLEHL